VFVYRREPREVAQQLGIDCSKFDGDSVPVVFTVSFQDPAGYFIATKMQMRPFDVVYAANAPAVDITKVLIFINTALATADEGVTVVNDVKLSRGR
jgi:polysaccharide export outer membrane protein